MTKKKKLTYVDRCIYVDENATKPDADVSKIFKYLYDIAFMLAKKRNLFGNNFFYYKGFSQYFATLVYLRLTSPKTKLPEGDPHRLRPLKSCLNYMKKTLYAKSRAFSRSEFNFTTRADDIYYNGVLKENAYNSAYNSNVQFLRVDINYTLSNIDKMVNHEISQSWYGNDPELCYNLYLSVMLTLYRSFTVSKAGRSKLYINTEVDKNGRTLLIPKPNYEEILTNVMQEEAKLAPVVYNLPGSYLTYVTFIARKVRLNLAKEIGELIDNYSLPEDVIQDAICLDARSRREEE